MQYCRDINAFKTLCNKQNEKSSWLCKSHCPLDKKWLPNSYRLKAGFFFVCTSRFILSRLPSKAANCFIFFPRPPKLLNFFFPGLIYRFKPFTYFHARIKKLQSQEFPLPKSNRISIGPYLMHIPLRFSSIWFILPIKLDR